MESYEWSTGLMVPVGDACLPEHTKVDEQTSDTMIRTESFVQLDPSRRSVSLDTVQIC